MLQKNYTVHVPEYILEQEQLSFEDCLFFDIETTGLSWKSSHLYLLGAVFMENGQWVHRQWFCQRPGEEKEVLQAFSELLISRKTVIHYNGTTFDVPYLMHKYTFYQQPSPWENIRQIDLYQLFSPLKKLLHLDHMRQKNLEEVIGLHREDLYSGGELIKIYKKYLLGGDEDLLSLLLLHNKEDVEGMLALLPLFSVRALWNGTSVGTVTCSFAADGHMRLSFHPEHPFPVSFEKDTSYGHLFVHSQEVRLDVASASGTKKYFYPNYKDYYYLPLEDEAIHKSVGAYVDKDHRKRATADTCYKKVNGTFYPQYKELFTPAFRDERRKSDCWFLPAENFADDQASLLKYFNHLTSVL